VRVVFVPIVPSPDNNLDYFRSSQSSRITRNLSIRYKTGTVKTRAAGCRQSLHRGDAWTVRSVIVITVERRHSLPDLYARSSKVTSSRLIAAVRGCSPIVAAAFCVSPRCSSDRPRRLIRRPQIAEGSASEARADHRTHGRGTLQSVAMRVALARQRADNSHALLGCSQEDLGVRAVRVEPQRPLVGRLRSPGHWRRSIRVRVVDPST
jgi:hypothetical protein